jgi:AsmA family protein
MLIAVRLVMAAASPNSRKGRFPWARAVWITLAIVLALPVLALIALAFVDWNNARGWIEARVAERTGRQLDIGGDLGVQPFSFHPRVHAEQVRFANAPWGDTRPMLEADNIDFRVSLIRLLAGDLVFTEVALGNATVFLQRDAQGLRNWILKKEEKQSERDDAPQIHRLTLNDARIAYKDAITDSDLVVNLQSTKDATYAVAMAAEGKLMGAPLKVKGGGGGLLRLMDTNAPYPLKLDGSYGDARASVEGTVTGLASLTALDANMSISGSDLALLGDALNITLPPSKPYRLSGRLEHQADEWRLSRFRGSVGKSDLNGDLVVATAGKNRPRPMLTARTNSRNLDIADLGGFVGAEPGKKESKQPAGKVLPHAPIRLERLRRMDADFKLVATRFQNRDKLPLDNLDATLKLDNGVLKLEPVVFGVAGGNVRLMVQVNARDSNKLATSGDVNFRKLHINKLIPGTEKLDQSFGAVDGRIKLAGTGNSTAAILGSANGRIDLFSPGGQISNLVMEYAGADLAEIVKFWLGGDQQIQLRCGVMSFDVKGGVASSNAIVVDTDDTYIGGEGTISLKDESLNLTLTPLPKDTSIVTLRGPLKVTGSFDDPKFGLEKKSLARKAGAAVLLALINPLAALIPLVDIGPGKDAPCQDLVKSVQSAAKESKPPAQPKKG